MTPIVFFLVLIGVSYTAYLLTRFIVWLDGADEPNTAPDAREPLKTSDAPDKRHSDAA